MEHRAWGMEFLRTEKLLFFLLPATRCLLLANTGPVPCATWFSVRDSCLLVLSAY